MQGFAKHENFILTTSGLVIPLDHPELGATPEGVFIEVCFKFANKQKYLFGDSYFCQIQMFLTK